MRIYTGALPSWEDELTVFCSKTPPSEPQKVLGVGWALAGLTSVVLTWGLSLSCCQMSAGAAVTQLATHSRWLPHRAPGRALGRALGWAVNRNIYMWSLHVTWTSYSRALGSKSECSGRPIRKPQVFLRHLEPIFLTIQHSPVFSCSDSSLSLPRFRGLEKWTPSLVRVVARSRCRRGYGIGDIRTTFGRYKLPQKIPWESGILAGIWRQQWSGEGEALQAIRQGARHVVKASNRRKAGMFEDPRKQGDTGVQTMRGGWVVRVLHGVHHEGLYRPCQGFWSSFPKKLGPNT